MTTPAQQFMPAVYAAIEAVSEGKADEIEIHTATDMINGDESMLNVTIRRHVRPPFVFQSSVEDDGE